MFQYTKASIDILVSDCKRYAKIFKYVSLLATIGLLIYQIISSFNKGSSMAYIYIGLAAAFVIFTILDFILDFRKLKNARKIAKRIYSWIKITAKAVVLGFAIYEITIAEKVDGIQIILTTLMILMWIISIFSQIIFQVVQARAEELLVAVKQDVDDIKKPVTTVTNVFKKLTGQEIKKDPEDPIKEKILIKLKNHIDNDKHK